MELGSCRDELIRTAQDATAQVAIEAAAEATAEGASRSRAATHRSA